MSAVDQTKICVICKNQNEDAIFSQLMLKGSESINRASRERADAILTVPGEFVHQT